MTEDFIKVYKIALNKLARREYCTNEMRQKLASKASADVVEAVISKLQKENALSESRFAEMLICHYSQAGYGPRRICLEFLKRGAEKEIAFEELRKSDICWDEQAFLQLTKKFSNEIRIHQDLKIKMYRFLLNRGFSENDVKVALTRFISEKT